ncbi:NAD(P)/FAD-dependent oxidoreductase [Reyranella sp.]|uniref:NAD(P)/FAD-dependent oxidoreductase n=1 Tax=Reyranella sp. TaxID=1929291 RepID=UPI003BAB3BCA
MTGPKVVVIGAGLVGASIAWHLARAGARVTVVEAGPPGGVASGASWGWINAGRGEDAAYGRLRVEAKREWRRLQRDLPGLPVAWPGSLAWERPPGEFAALAACLAAWSETVQLVAREEIGRRVPALAAPPDVALLVPDDGTVEPDATVLSLLAAAQSLDTQLNVGVAVHALVLRGGRVTGVATGDGAIDADHVVVAAGAGTAPLLSPIGLALPVDDPPALLVATRPLPPLIDGLLVTEAVEVRQRIDGRFLLAAGLERERDSATRAADAMRALAALLPATAGADIERHVAGRRPIPADGHPIVGPVPGIEGLHVAVMHAGATLAAAVGRFLGDEIITAKRSPLLARFGPCRFMR